MASNRTLPQSITLLLATMILAGSAALPCAAFAHGEFRADDYHTSAVNLIGWDGVDAGSHGDLRIDAEGLAFVRDGIPHRIGWSDLRRFAVERTSRGLIRGTGGTIASFSPQGAGQLYSAIRPGAQALSLLYADARQGLHAAVVILPANSRNALLAAFSQAGVQPSAVLTLPAEDTVEDRPARQFIPAMDGRRADGQGDVLVRFPRSRTQAMPAAYAAEMYEETLGQLAKSRRFAAVWREGDVRAGPDASLLTTTITRVRKGNAGARGALPVLGMVIGKTSIEADVSLTDAGGTIVLDTRLKGSKSMPGESIGASKAFARHVDHSMKEVSMADRGW